MTYREFAPPPDLAGHVSCLWARHGSSRSSSGESRVHRVLPDGSADIILSIASSAREGSGQATALVVGTMTRPLLVEERDRDLFVGLRLLPGSAYLALGVPAAELTDQLVRYDELFGDGAALEDDVAEGEIELRLSALARLVRRRLGRAGRIPAAVCGAVRRIASAGGNVRIAGLAAELGVTRQLLARQFALHVGISPKTFARVMRARAAVAMAGQARSKAQVNADWSRIAHELGYYDQPHFIQEFKEIVGLTPGEWDRVNCGFFATR